MANVSEEALVEFTNALVELNNQWAKVVAALRGNEWITIQEAMKRTGLTYVQVRYRVEDGTFETCLMDKKKMVSAYSVSKYMEDHSQSSYPARKREGLVKKPHGGMDVRT